MHYKSALFFILSLSLFSCSSSFKPIKTGIYIPNAIVNEEKKEDFDYFELTIEKIDRDKQEQYNKFEDPYSNKILKDADKIYLCFDLSIYKKDNNQEVKLQCYDFRLEKRYWKTILISVEDYPYNIDSLIYVPFDNLLSFCYYDEI